MAKKLLKESTIRRFQKLANVAPINEMYSQNEEYLNEEDELEDEEEGAPAADFGGEEEGGDMGDMDMDADAEGGMDGDLELTDEEAQDLSKEDKAELMKQGGKSKSKDKRQTMIDLSEKLGLSSEGKEKQDIEYEIDERYDEGGVEDAPKPKFDYKKFFKKRYADGGAIGIEVLFETPANELIQDVETRDKGCLRHQ